MCKSENTDSLQFITDTYTVTAENTFVRISYDRRRTKIQRHLLSGVLKSYFHNTQSVCKKLKITFSALYTSCTVTAVCCEKQFHDQFSVFFQSSGICIDNHSIPWFFGTGCKHSSSVVFYRTQTTCAEGRQFRMIAKCGNIDSCFADYG